MSTPEEEATISIPSIAFVAVLGFLLYRYFFAATPTSSSSSQSTSRTGTGGQRFTAAQVDQVAQMFPQLNRRDIMWDLHRNRGSVTTTTERILAGGRLDPAPVTFQPILPQSTSTSTSTSTFSPLTSASKPPTEPDLITRYNLQSRIDVSGKGKGKEVDGEQEKNYGWSPLKDERQKMLERRRDEMILQARRRMQERDATKTGEGTGL